MTFLLWTWVYLLLDGGYFWKCQRGGGFLFFQSFGFDVISTEAAQLVEGVSVYQMIGSTVILGFRGSTEHPHGDGI